MKNFKKCLSLLLVFAITISSSSVVFAETPELDVTENVIAEMVFTVGEDGEIIPCNTGYAAMLEEKETFGIGPQNTVYAQAGAASLSWTTKTQIYWSIAPNDKSKSWTLMSSIKIYEWDNENKKVWSTQVNTSGKGNKDGLVYPSGLWRGRMYIARFTGGGTIGGVGWSIAPNCHAGQYA